MRTVIITQARMTSTRLPGKVLKQVLGKSLLSYQLDRLKKVSLADQVVVATTENISDDEIERLCNEEHVSCFRGSESDVLSRYYGAARKYAADIIVRVTSDCPLIDPAIVNLVIAKYKHSHPLYDYVSNVLQRTYPRGMDTEVFSFKVLAEAQKQACLSAHREHVTSYIYSQPAKYKLGNVCNQQDMSAYRWTVDTPEDFILINHILSVVYPAKPDFSMEDCLAAYEKHPEWHEINSHIEQKKI